MTIHPPRTGRRAALRTLLGAPLVVPRSVRAQDAYPSRPIRLIVPFAPGGGTDILGRTLAQKLGPALGTTVIVENRPGAGGNLGAEQVAHAAPDGHTLLIVSASYAVNASFQPPKFDPVRGLAPIAQIASVPFLLLARESLPVLVSMMAAQGTRGDVGFELIRWGDAAVPNIVDLIGLSTDERLEPRENTQGEDMIRAYLDHWKDLDRPVDPRVIAAVRKALASKNPQNGMIRTTYHAEFLEKAAGEQ